MNSQEKMNALRQMLTLVFGVLAGFAPGLATQQQYSEVTSAIITIIPAAISLYSVCWSVWAHWNQIKVPEKATALLLPDKLPVGTVANLTPMTGMAKVVGILLACVVLLGAVPAFAQGKTPFDKFNDALGQKISTNPVQALSTDVAKMLNDLADFGDAATLATQIPGLQDNVGSACWQQFAPIQALLKAHPLPLTLKVATDIEALRLAALGLNQVCANPNCGSMWNDAANAANAITGAPLPISLGSLCSKVPVITTAAAAAGTTTAPIGTSIPATAATPAAK